MDMIPQNKYDYILENMPVVCVDICILYDNTVLIAKRNNPPCKDQWFIPGGRVLKNEHLRDTARRKVKEETGLDCIIHDIIHVEETIFPDGVNDIQTHTVNICFQASIDTLKDVKLNNENSEYKWITLDKIDNFNLHPYVQNCLKKVYINTHI